MVRMACRLDDCHGMLCFLLPKDVQEGIDETL